MRTLWRLHIRPYGGNGNPAESVAFCLDNKVVGMGWPLPNEAVTRSTDIEWFKQAASREYKTDSWRSVKLFAEGPAIGDLVWFRNTEGRFYLAELLSNWEYAYEDDGAIGADIENFRHARIIDVGLADAVPGKIVACFRPAQTFQRIQPLGGMLAFSEQLAGLPISGDTSFDLYKFLSDADLENVLFVYLQVKGWFVLPGTRTATTAHYEFVLVNRESGQRAIVQVRSGGSSIDASSYAGQEKAFLFATSGNYGSAIPSNAVIITQPQLNAFMRDMTHLLPRAIQTWIDMFGLPIEHLFAEV